jgi:hypothetical protein
LGDKRAQLSKVEDCSYSDAVAVVVDIFSALSTQEDEGEGEGSIGEEKEEEEVADLPLVEEECFRVLRAFVG